ncbi:putative lipoprotein [Caballeronia temeraria]|uniref:Lipoprotein n=1 Tax=Caballeronia temeraria TaxID=1777137 RepID=A0A157ZCS1_9BURK|nr:DUF1254 domain-containing protein [Caballeronia temeraria]SAK42687.1 putative lipoprotein [Caballeronia temeraria]
MDDQNEVNSTRRLVTAMGAALPLAYASLAGMPRTAEAAAPKDNASTSPNPAAKTSVNETLPPAGILMHPEYAQVIARMAYVWAWPMVNMLNRNARITKAPHPGLLGGVLPAAPRGQIGMLHDYIDPAETFVTCPNQDVVYGLGFFSLDEEPVVAQVPDFGDRFWVYALYDARTNQFGHIGKPYRTQRGFYLLVGPNWKGRKPAGITEIVRCPTALANAIPRVFQNDTPEDKAAIQKVINQIVFYPLKQFDGRMKTIDWMNAPIIQPPAQAAGSDEGGGETKWVIPEQFFDQFPQVLDTVPALPGEEALYAQFRSLMEVASRDPDIKKLLVSTAIDTERQVIGPFFEWRRNGLPAGKNWNRSTNNAQTGFDYFDRTGTAKSNMFDNRPNETQYFYTDFDASGQALNGANTYEIVFAKGEEPPVNGFWSLTLYNDKHLFHANDLKRYSLGTKNSNLKRNADGSLTLYAGAKSPGAERESNWLPAPDGAFSLYIRAYWGKAPILDGSWTPPQIRTKT